MKFAYGGGLVTLVNKGRGKKATQSVSGGMLELREIGDGEGKSPVQS